MLDATEALKEASDNAAQATAADRVGQAATLSEERRKHLSRGAGYVRAQARTSIKFAQTSARPGSRSGPNYSPAAMR